MKAKRAPQPPTEPAGLLFRDRAALATLRNFPDRRNGITLALETLTDVDWLLEFPDDSDRRRYSPELPSDTWHPIDLEPVQVEIANTDPEGFIGILCALLKGWWPSEEEHQVIRVVHTVLQQLTWKDWTHNHVQGPEVGVVFSAPVDDGRIMFLSRTQIDDGLEDTQYIVALVDKKLQGEFPAVFDHGLHPEIPADEKWSTPPMANGSEDPLDIALADTLFTRSEGKTLTDNPGARMERSGLVLTAVNEFGRTVLEQELAEHAVAGLVVDDENGLLNWEGANYVKQTLLQEYQMAAKQVGDEQVEEITRLKKAYAELLQQREIVDPNADSIYERDRAEAVELVDAMVAGAGFEMLRDGADGSGALWQQHLADLRPGIQIFLTVPEGVLAAGPAEVFRYVKQNTGATL